MFTNFSTEIVSDVSEITEFSSLAVNERPRVREHPRKEFAHVHDSDRRWNDGIYGEASSRPCWICGATDHLIRNCEEFKRMNIAERLEEVEHQGLCEVCLNKHGGGRCFSIVQCTVRDCRGNHHPLLHRVEESVQLLKTKSDCSVIFRTIPVTLYVENQQYDTVAFLDEGSSATLVDDAVARQLKANGILEPLMVTWTGNINRLESQSRAVDMMISAKGSREKFPLFHTRTVTELQLPKQNVRYTELVQRYRHLSEVPKKDFPSEVPTILIGLDNLHLFAPLESRIGKPREPIAVRSKMGWSIYGPDQQKYCRRTFLNLHSVKTVKWLKIQDMTKKMATTSFTVPNLKVEEYDQQILETTNPATECGTNQPRVKRRVKKLARKPGSDVTPQRSTVRQLEVTVNKATEVELRKSTQETNVMKGIDGDSRKRRNCGVVDECIVSGGENIQQTTNTKSYMRASAKPARMRIDSGNPEPDVASGRVTGRGMFWQHWPSLSRLALTDVEVTERLTGEIEREKEQKLPKADR
nr:uncharacterized protein LOC109433286 [Aedes albopictus]